MQRTYFIPKPNLHPMNNRFYLMLSTAVALTCLTNCHYPTQHTALSDSASSATSDHSSDIISGEGYEFFRNGKKRSAVSLAHLYTPVNSESLSFPQIDNKTMSALEQQLTALQYKKRQKPQQIASLDISIDQMEKTIQLLKDGRFDHPKELAKSFQAYQIKGEDGRGNVHFTGYYTPILKVSKTPDAVYKYPLYAYPKNWEGRLPSRAEIDGNGALNGRGLELAYVKNPLDIYFMQVQGSGIVEYKDGTQELFAFSGSNRHKYKSIGRYMIDNDITTVDKVSINSIKKFFEKNPDRINEILFENPSYVFFTPRNSHPRGAGLVPLTPQHSIAVDTRFIPLGSCLLAAVPIVDESNRVVRHEYRILVAQDIGGAINGPGHVDLYTGIGPAGQKAASALHHYGSLWLLAPKSSQPIAPIALADTK